MRNLAAILRRRRRSPFGPQSGGGVIAVLTLIEDGLEEAIPFYSMSSSAAGTLYWDFHSSATPPAAGAGDHLTGTQAIGSGITVWDTDLSSAAGETGFIHYRCTNSAGTSNILTSQEITVPADFSPEDVAGLAMWYDFSDSATITLSGSEITQITDKSGNSRTASQGTSANRPLIATAVQNGLNVARFDGSNDNLTIANALSILNNVSGFSIFIVRKFDTSTVRHDLMGFGTNAAVTGRVIIGQGITANKPFVGGRRLDANSFVRVDGTNSVSTSVFQLQEAIIDFANSNIYQYIDGVLDGSSTSFQTDGNTSATNSAEAPQISSWAGNDVDGDIGEIVVYVGALNDTDRGSVESYLMTKWGL